MTEQTYYHVEPSADGRPTPKQIKEWYRQLAILLNRLEMSGEEIDLIDDEQYGKRVQGLTSVAFKTSPNVRGTWSVQ